MDMSVIFFAGDSAVSDGNPYDLMMRCAEAADRLGLTAVWLPERHFHRFGGLFPNPAVAAAAVAARTTRIRIRAGSVIVPLHDPIRVVEEWSMVDNLSDGRVDLSFGQGWNPVDFVLAPDSFANRLQRTLDGIDTVRRLWRGEPSARTAGDGTTVDVTPCPSPAAGKLDVWLTCSGSVERFVDAGSRGFNVLTALLFQSTAELRHKIAAYRQARAEHGHDPSTGQVTLMLHTYLAGSVADARSTVADPLRRYLAESVSLWRRGSTRLDLLTERQREALIHFAFERYVRSSALCGTVESCAPFVDELAGCGVTEIACLVDFGVPTAAVVDSLDHVAHLHRRVPAAAAERRAEPDGR